MLAFSLLSIIGSSFGWDYYPSFYQWDFQNHTYLSFNQAINFTNVPHQGVPHDSSLLAYYKMDEPIGIVACDSSGNGKNGTLCGYDDRTIPNATSVAGKYGNALNFDGSSNYVDITSILNGMSITQGSISLYFKPQSLQNNFTRLISNEGGAGQRLYLGIATSKLWYRLGDLTDSYSNTVLHSDQWYHVTLTWWNNNNTTYCQIYVNGQPDGSQQSGFNFTRLGSIINIGRAAGSNIFLFSGTIDDVRIYNRALSIREVATLYSMGPYMQPDPVAFANYCSYTAPVTNSTMLIHVDSPNANSNNVAVVTCTNFFTDDRLVFQANNTSTVNVWTNVGQPVFTTGVWNSQNYTTTLSLDASSTAEINWNTYNITTYVDAHSGVLPSNVAVGYGGSQTFNFNASQGYRFNVVVDDVSQGQISSYTFSNVTVPHTVNVTSTQLFTITASADGNGSITPSGPVVMDYGESQRFNFTANIGYHVSDVLVDNTSQSLADSYTFSNVAKNYTIVVSFAIRHLQHHGFVGHALNSHSRKLHSQLRRKSTVQCNRGFWLRQPRLVDGVDQGLLTSYNLTNIQVNHIISVTSEAVAPIGTSSPAPDKSPSTSPASSPEVSQFPQTSGAPSPSQTPTSTTKTNKFPTETVLIAAAAIAATVALLALAFKKGYIAIEIADEETSGATTETAQNDYSI